MIVADRYEELSDEAYRLYKRDLHVMQSIAFPGERSCFVVKAPYHTPFVDVILRHFPRCLFCAHASESGRCCHFRFVASSSYQRSAVSSRFVEIGT